MARRTSFYCDHMTKMSAIAPVPALRLGLVSQIGAWTMEQVLGLRPFVPAKDLAVSKRYYEALGFAPTHEDDGIVILKLESFSFILQKFYVKELAENFMLQLMVRNVDLFWERVEAARLDQEFGVRPPRPPAMQSWGMRVGFLFDPSGVLWHIADSMF
jgi:catechol 2,3-dioxygenase-like lactoylglutathione lyase family enzyme